MCFLFFFLHNVDESTDEMMYKTILFPLVGQSVCHIHYTIKQTCLTFKRTSVINRIFYTVEGVLSILAVSRLISLSFLKSQYTRSIHNKSWQSKFIMSYLKNSPGLKKVLRLFNESLDLSHCLLRVRYMASLGGGGGGVSVSLTGPLPLAPLAPVLWCEVKAFWIYTQVSLLHRSFVTVHNVLWESQDVLTLHARDNKKKRNEEDATSPRHLSGDH